MARNFCVFSGPTRLTLCQCFFSGEILLSPWPGGGGGEGGGVIADRVFRRVAPGHSADKSILRWTNSCNCSLLK